MKLELLSKYLVDHFFKYPDMAKPSDQRDIKLGKFREYKHAFYGKNYRVQELQV